MKPWTIYPSSDSKPNIRLDDMGGDILLISGIHGDEPCGWKGVERFYRSHWDEIKQPITVVFANTKAAMDNERYIETDLNRLFDFNPDNGLYEEKLANEISSIIDNFELVVSLHSTQSTPKPFVLLSPPVNDVVFDTCSIISVPYGIYDRQNRGSLSIMDNVLEIECGYQKSEEAIENAYKLIKEVAIFHDVLNGESPKSSNYDMFEITGKLPKDSSIELVVENFNLVKKGVPFAYTETGEEQIAEFDFVPVLCSENGYENIIGYTGKYIGSLYDLKEEY